MLKNSEYTQDPQSWKVIFQNNMLEDIAKMSKEEWREKLRLQTLYLNRIRNEEQKQKEENDKNRDTIYRLVDTYSIVDEFILLSNQLKSDKYQIVFGGIKREEQILDGTLSRYYVTESKERISEEECEQQVTKEVMKCILQIIGISFASFIGGLTRVIKPSTALMLCVSSPVIIYGKALIEYQIKPVSFTDNDYKTVKKLYARHYQNDVLLKYVDQQTPCGNYNHMI